MRALLAIPVLALIFEACGGSDSTIVFVPTEAGAVDSSSTGDASIPDGSTSHPSDSSAPRDAAGDACAPPVSADPYSDDCTVAASACSCAEGVHYRCQPTGRVGQPRVLRIVSEDERLPGCRALGSVSGVSDYCCPPACVRSKSLDSECFGSRPSSWSCAANPDGTSVVGYPKAGCSHVGNPQPGALTERYCCE